MQRPLVRTARFIGLICALLMLVPASLAAARPAAQTGSTPATDLRQLNLTTQPPVATDLADEVGLAAAAKPAHPKLDSALNSLAEAAARGGAAVAETADSVGARLKDDRVQIHITADAANAAALRAAVADLGGEVTGGIPAQNLFQGFLPAAALTALADSPAVSFVALPEYVTTDQAATPTVGGFNTAGVAAMNANAWHAAGYRGAGVKVAIIDGGFIGYTNAVASGDLPANVTAVSFADGQGPATDTEHGTACAEIVYDIAPQATLYIIKVGTIVDLNEAITYAISQGVRVISTSINWFNEGSGDGTGLLPNEVNRARNAGIIWFTSAGNYRDTHYASDFVSGDGDTWHDFAPGQEVNCFAPTAGGACYNLPAGISLRVFLRWADWAAPVDQDYDLFIYRWNGSAWVEFAKSEGVQNGGAGQRPTEAVGFVTAGATAQYGIALKRFSASQTAVNLDIFAPGAPMRYRTAARSIGNIAPASNVVAVAALDVNAPFPLESYSSAGPRNGPGGVSGGGVVKPDLSGFANVDTQSYGTTPGSKFNGTSSATPHVAGAAVLVRSAYSAYNVGDTWEFLRSRAVDMGAAGMDTSFGWGRVWLGAAPTAFSPRRRFDFNANQRSDIFWRNVSTGANAVWLMSSSTVGASAGMPTVSDLNWKIVGSGDFNGDNRADMLWRRDGTGANAIWFMNGTAVPNRPTITTLANLNWRVVGTGDFNADGRSDILWRNIATGANSIWFMNGTTASGVAISSVSDVNWKIMGTGDFNADGRADILWRNTAGGANAIWFMNGSNVIAGASITAVADQNWRIVGVGDFNADKHSDILWRNAASGSTSIWTMRGSVVASGVGIGTVPTSWQVIHNGDFNGDNRADILWRNTGTGNNSIWFMNGTLGYSGVAITPQAVLSWRMIGNTEAGGASNVGPYVVADSAGTAIASDPGADGLAADGPAGELMEIGPAVDAMETSAPIPADQAPGAGEPIGEPLAAGTTIYLPMLLK